MDQDSLILIRNEFSNLKILDSFWLSKRIGINEMPAISRNPINNIEQTVRNKYSLYLGSI